MDMMPLLLLLALQGDPDDVLRDFKAALAHADAAGRTLAVQKALETPHDRVIRAVGELLLSDVEDVRIGVAAALAEVDHPVAADVLLHGLSGNEKRPEVVAAIAAALAELGWQSVCPALEGLLKRAGAAEVRDILPDVVDTLGRLGSPTSVDPLQDLVRLFEGPRRSPWKGEGELRRKAEAALQAITGYAFRSSGDFDAWWKANRASLLAGSRRTWWMKKTGEREQSGSADKAPADALLVATRLVEPAAARPARTKKKRK
jgi:HEAT repeat protein